MLLNEISIKKFLFISTQRILIQSLKPEIYTKRSLVFLKT